MVRKQDILEFLREHKTEFFVKYQLINIGLFGSYSKNTATEDSDIDILLEFKPNTQNLAAKKAEIKSIIKSKFKTDVDICREKYVKPYFKNQIKQSVIYV